MSPAAVHTSCAVVPRRHCRSPGLLILDKVEFGGVLRSIFEYLSRIRLFMTKISEGG